MANNRMYLCCTLCASRADTSLEQCVVYLAKYYPHAWSSVGAADKLQAFFEQHAHVEGGNAGQLFALNYEGVFSETGRSKLELLDTLSKVLRPSRSE